MSAGVTRASIVIPAHDEQGLIRRCLTRLLTRSTPGEWAVLVVVNGSTDATADVARAFAAETGHDVRVHELRAASKIHAVRTGLALAAPGVCVVVDADVVLDADTLSALVDALEAVGDAERIACPRLVVDASGSRRLVQAYYRTWTALPYVRRSMVGSGVYALNAAATRRVGELPPVINDDGWVRRSFTASERITTPGTFTSAAPRTVGALHPSPRPDQDRQPRPGGTARRRP